MKKVAVGILFIAGFLYLLSAAGEINKQKEFLFKEQNKRQWLVKSVDTMKFSRDVAAEKSNDDSFNTTIEEQIKSIVSTGATHVTVDTPYDEQFYPFLLRWVKSARRHRLNIWFRGNFSGWQGWFGYPKNLTQIEHIEQTRNFIKNHSEIFLNGDIFSPCPECENGGEGDPRATQLVDVYRQFLINERLAALEEFSKIEKKVMVIDSMNYDVASLIMDRDTAAAMGGIVVIDHYVKTAEQMKNDIESLSRKTNAKIILGEFGAPIPDIHGRMSEQEQAKWIDESLALIVKQPELIGINYWVSHGGSTAIFNSRNMQKPAARILEIYFKLDSLPD